MNRTLSLLVLTALAACSMVACEKQTLGNKIDDVTNQRPAEKLQDKVEDIGDAIKK